MNCHLLTLVVLFHSSGSTQPIRDECVANAQQSCAYNNQLAYAKSTALSVESGSIITDIQLVQPQTYRLTYAYCEAVVTFAECLERAINSSCSESDTKHAMMLSVKHHYVIQFGDPRAFIAEAGVKCQQMIGLFYPKDGEKFENDASAELLCAQTCGYKYGADTINRTHPFQSDVHIAGVCRNQPGMYACLRRCGASQALISQCNASVTAKSSAEHEDESEMHQVDVLQHKLLCTQTCAMIYTNAQAGSNLKLVALCSERPELNSCLMNCSADESLMARCNLPSKCAYVNKNQSETSPVTVQETCEKLPDLIDCTLPVIRYVPNAILGMRISLSDMQATPEFARDASTECRQKIITAIAALDLLLTRSGQHVI